MDHTRKQAVKWSTLMATALSAQTRDPTDVLAEARDRLLAMRAPLSKISCTVTIDRSYFARANPPERAPSCDQVAADRKKGRYKLKLYATDRIRLKSLFAGGREVFSWVEPLKF